MFSSSHFQSDPNFCPECGEIFPLPVMNNRVKCVLCGFEVDGITFDKLTADYDIKSNNREKYKKLKTNDGQKAADGPTVDRECSKCGHQGMTYATLQTRSADEGQTVFYSCPSCKHQEHENS
ncbi:DNA-directed RNA polymerase I subunit RPA12 [Caerostris extrusa]|uniref:DNA-directed RNA polymerase subunit n=1 Tax=Caerostris extrusa TaxID=172846 RepID=A0AAV4XEG7_CAEEX|nr:DNA-directed RNA polymerase I subunit RPA12 [Caerostris extrusa]